MPNATDYLKKKTDEPEQLDGDMQPGDVLDTLRRLKFIDDQCRVISIDKPIRDNLCRAVTALRQK
jgi:hypothetical protein